MAVAPRISVLVAWLGIALTAIVSILALRHLATDLLRIARHLVAGDVSLVALAITGLGLAAGVAGLVLVARWAGRGPSEERRALFIGFGVLLAVRSAVALAFDGARGGELLEYDQLTRGVLEGACCFGDRPMGYPVVLAPLYALLGRGPIAVEALNIGLALLGGWALLLVARRLYGARVGLVALYAYAVWPAGALMVAARLPHTMYDTLVVLAMLPALVLAPGWRGSALTGALLAIAQYVRPTTPALLVAFLAARVWAGPMRARAVAAAVVPLVAVFVLLLLPVIEHNLRTHAELSLSTSAYGGHSLYVGTDLRSEGRWTRRAHEEIVALGDDQWTRSERAGELAMERIRADPVGMLLLAVRKQETLWGSERYGVQYGIKRELASRPQRSAAMLPLIASGAFWVVVTAATAAGLYIQRRRHDPLVMLLVSMLVLVAASHALLEVRDRYHSYVVPAMLPLAAVGLVALLVRLRLIPPEASPATTSTTAPLADAQVGHTAHAPR